MYQGSERRKLLNLRRLIDKAPARYNKVLKEIARMLGPDRLRELDEKLASPKEVKRIRREMAERLRRKTAKPCALAAVSETRVLDPKIADTPVWELRLSKYTFWHLGVQRVKKIGELASMTDTELQNLFHFAGERTAREIRGAIAELEARPEKLSFEQLFGELKPRYREIMGMRMAGSSCKEIGKHFGRHEGSIREMTNKAERYLRRNLGRCKAITREDYEKYQYVFRRLGFASQPTESGIEEFMEALYFKRRPPEPGH
jgi:hypothetical protein